MKFLSAALLAGTILCCVPTARAQISIGIILGAPPPPRVVYVEPPRPGPAYVWVEGYWFPFHHHYRWHEGYWTLPPYEGAYWIAPHYEHGRYFVGYWNGDRGRVDHDHRWDRDRERDFHYHERYERDRGHSRDRDHGRDHDRGHGHGHGRGHDD